MFDTFPNDTDDKALALLSRSGVGTPIAHVLRDMAAGGPGRRRLPTSSLRQSRRDMTGAEAPGAYLIATDTGPVESLVRAYSVVGSAGLRTISGLVGNLVIPRVTVGASASWISAEGDVIPESQPTVGQLSLSAKYCGLRLDCSRQLLVQSQAEAVIEQQLGEAVGTAIDAAIFGGSGNLGEPLGILATSGVHSQSGTSLSWAGLQAMVEAVQVGGARWGRMVWFASPSAAEILATRERASGSGYCLDNGAIAGRPCITTDAVPDGSLVLADPGRITLAIFDGAGVGVSRDDFSSFSSGLASFRLLVGIDIGIAPAAAFAAATSIT
jgi:HK97 family phage major capsid protein